MRSFRASLSIAAWLALAGACARTGVSYQPRDAYAPVATAAAPACYDSVESRAIACSGGVARRVGDTLFIRLDDGRDKLFVTGHEGEAPGGYQYYGHVARPRLQIVESNGHESYPEKLYVDTRSGRMETIGEELLISPDSSRVLASASDWANCAEGNGGYLSIWEMTDTLPRLEWHMQTFDCGKNGGWGASGIGWRGRDTIYFQRSDSLTSATFATTSQNSLRTHRTLLVHDGSGWRMVQPAEK